MSENESNTNYTEIEKETVRIQNEYRIMLGLNVLLIEDKLTRASHKHSQHMQSVQKIAHDGIGNGDGRSRAKDEGFKCPVGENIALQESPKGAFNAWYWSYGHHLNMIRGILKYIGVGVVDRYYTTMFGG
jgi:uncharacterized protein YkwD